VISSCGRLGRSLAITSVGLFLAFGASTKAFQGALRAQDLLADPPPDLLVVPQVVGIFPGFQGPIANSKTQILKQVRGLIQNELSIIGELCGLNKNQQQRLVDLAESEWKAKTSASVIKGTQENVYGAVDLDGLAERVVRTWLEATATVEQLGVYDAELADRMKWRQKALVSKILDTLEAKLNLSGVQMEQIEMILNEKWKDRWYRSLEATFDNSAILPEIRPSWITELLTDAQKAALVTRDPQTRFGMHQGSPSFPLLAMDKRYTVGTTTSSDSIELEPGSNKAKDAARQNIDEGPVNAKKP